MKRRTIFLSLLSSAILLSNIAFSQTTVQLAPLNAVNATGYVGADNVNRSGDMINIGQGQNDAYITFDLSTIPNGAVITAATLTFNVDPFSTNIAVNGNPPTGSLTSIGKNSVNAQVFFDDIQNGAVFANNVIWDGTPGSKSTSFNALGVAAIQNKSGTNIGIGILPPQNNTSSYGKIAGYSATSPAIGKPILAVTYTTQPPQKPYPDFYAEKISVRMDTSVKFFDNSGNSPTAWLWNFGDGTTSTIKNPTHSYSDTLLYTVSLKATNGVGDSTITKTNYIKIKPIPPTSISGFTVDNKRPYQDSIIQFTDTSKNKPVSWMWYFGDDSTSTLQHPSHTYLSAGKYTVSLVTTIADGRSDSLGMKDYIEVLPEPTIPHPDFEFVVNGLKVDLTDISKNFPTTWSWSFGDASSAVTTQNTSHTYTAAGTYDITLTASNIKGDSSVTKKVTVIANIAPNAEDDEAITQKNKAVNIDVLINDNDPEGKIDTASLAIENNPKHGTVMINALTGRINYNPANNYIGKDTFSYSFKDKGTLSSNIAKVFIVVNQVQNTAPDAGDDIKTVDKNFETIIYVLTNDFDINGTIDTSSITIVSEPKHGTVMVNSPNGAITYKPSADYIGTDTLKYTIKDNEAEVSNPAFVYITVLNTSTGISSTSLNELNVFPNPASKEITIDLTRINGSKISLELYNSIGLLVLVEELKSRVDTYQLSIDYLPEGLYSVLIKTEQKTYIARILVQK